MKVVEVGIRLAFLRLCTGLDRSDFAKRCGLGVGGLRWVADVEDAVHSHVSVDALNAVSDALGIYREFLVDGKGDRAFLRRQIVENEAMRAEKLEKAEKPAADRDGCAAYLWLDLETTGLNPHLDSVVEVAYVLTETAAPFRRITSGRLVGGGVSPSGSALVLSEGLPSHIHPKVVEMHRKSGLLADLDAAKPRLRDIVERSDWRGEVLTPSLLETRLLALSCDWPTERDKAVRLAGFSVHFDLSMMRAKAPTFARRLSHRVLDVSSISSFCRSLGMATERKEGAHRAAQDVQDAIERARDCVSWVEARRGA